MEWVEGPETIRHMTRYAMELLDPRRISDRKPQSIQIGGTDPACGAPLSGGLTYWLWTSSDLDSVLDPDRDDPERWPNWPTCWICAAILGEIVANLEPGIRHSDLVTVWIRLSNEFIALQTAPKSAPRPEQKDADMNPPDVTEDIF